jgi:hypothetical protein
MSLVCDFILLALALGLGFLWGAVFTREALAEANRMMDHVLDKWEQVHDMIDQLPDDD